jgi:hypothetical protein
MTLFPTWSLLVLSSGCSKLVQTLVSMSISILTRYMNRYDKHVFQYALRVLRYLAHTRNYGLVYDESSSPVCDYGKGVRLSFEVDSEWRGRTDDSKSTTGWIVKANNSSVYSGSLIQKRVATAQQKLNQMVWSMFAKKLSGTETF